MDEKSSQLEQRLLKIMFDVLPRLPQDAQERVARVAAAYCSPGHGMNVRPISHQTTGHGGLTREPVFGDREVLSAKAFLADKSPETDIERVTCLAYYLTHYRNQSHFKTNDITSLNTEAAQVRLSNPTDAVDNATKRGFLAPAGKGKKQISVLGERYVDALPNRETARGVTERIKPKRRRRARNSSAS